MSLRYLLDSDVFSLMVSGRDEALNQRIQPTHDPSHGGSSHLVRHHHR